MRYLALMAVIGLIACNPTVSDSGLCAGIKRPTAAHKAALIANAAQTPDPVGETGADVILGLEAGCQW